MDDTLYVGFSYGGRQPWDYGIRFCQGVLEHDHMVPHVRPARQATHAFFLYRGEIVEAVPPRVRRIPFDGRTNVRLYQLPNEHSADVWSSAEKTVGEWYNIPGYALALGYCLLQQPNWFFRSPLATVFCSQTVCDCLRAGGINALPGVPSVDVTPASLEWWAWSTLT
jgi:hypothetical protein